MAKLSQFNFEQKSDAKTITINDTEVQVLQNVPTVVKSTIVQSAAWGSVAQGIVDEILLDAYLHVLLVEYYTDIELDDENRGNLLQTFDLLQSNGVFEQIIEVMAEGEYDYLFNSTIQLAKKINEYNVSLAKFFQELGEANMQNVDLGEEFTQKISQLSGIAGGQG
jgi:hypothetical protein